MRIPLRAAFGVAYFARADAFDVGDITAVADAGDGAGIPSGRNESRDSCVLVARARDRDYANRSAASNAAIIDKGLRSGPNSARMLALFWFAATPGWIRRPSFHRG